MILLLIIYYYNTIIILIINYLWFWIATAENDIDLIVICHLSFCHFPM